MVTTPIMSTLASGEHRSATSHALDVYVKLASIPVVTAASVCVTDSSLKIEVDYSIRDHVRLLKRRCSQAFHIAKTSSSDSSRLGSFPGPSVLRGPLSEVPSEVVWKGYSPSGRKQIVFRKCGSANFIELWDTTINELKFCKEVTEAHGKFITNDTFGFPTWDSQEACIAYVAETKTPTKSANSSVAHKHRYVPDFGEQLDGIRLPALFLLPCEGSVSSDTRQSDRALIQVTNPSSASDVVYGQPVFGPGSSSNLDYFQIFCTGFASLPDGRRMGLIYCQNRLTAIYELKIQLKEAEKPSESSTTSVPASVASRRLSSLDVSARSPRVSGNHVYYISNPVGGAHGSCAALHYVSIPTMEDKVLVPAVEDAGTENLDSLENSFPGLYIDQLPLQPFLSHPTTGKQFLVTNSIWGSVRVLLMIDLSSGEVQRYKGPSPGSCTVWNTDRANCLIASFSQTTQPPVIWLGMLAQDGTMTWDTVEKLQANTTIEQQLLQTSSQVFALPPNIHGPTEIVYTMAKSPSTLQPAGTLEGRLPVVIIQPHGGPHSTSVNEFSPTTAAFALLGYSTAYINYPGSLGFGQKWVNHLINHLGVADVESSKLALDYLRAQKMVDPNQAIISGGSHGGFITAHLTSRYPDLFTAACMRNPVVDLVGTAAGGSDIPDWSFAEANLPFPMMGESFAPVMINDEAFKVLKSASPISQLHQVKTPTLLLLGDVDRRVSHQQGIAWYHGLQAQGTPSKIYMFPENSHPLSGAEAELASFEASFEHFSS
ncbi:acylpeptide hydrolase [Melampsora larici-populina 98AG31]|uniref:acylaminoacyl-peptidase n=1 Tax=Melampsora larici-populina (strain 98AG31 / pathotype 3-4-7) TaxID=747676 RepID=F4RIL2_MELLP|nr:acylpeptide hydrolase [Melampsora larici-populina 98AG31]EGG07815.1 acylpeptide hydrolase [Melampsora larici-populina 98AG31]